MRQSNNYESSTRRNGTHESAGLEHLFKAETGGLAIRHCLLIVVHVPSGIMIGHAVCGVCTEAARYACPIEVAPAPGGRPVPPDPFGHLVSESATVSRSLRLLVQHGFSSNPLSTM